MARLISFAVLCTPQAKGSTKGFLPQWPRKSWNYVKKKACLMNLVNSYLETGKYPVISITSTNENLKTYEKLIKNKAEAAMVAVEKPFDTAVRLTVCFYMPRPKNHYGTGARALIMKAWAKVMYHIKKPDLDKLVRAVGDAMNGTVYTDDSVVVEILARKRYATKPGVRIKVEELEPMSEHDPTDILLQPALFELEQVTQGENGVLR